MAKFQTTYNIESKTYAAIFHTAEHLLDMAERHELGRLLNLQAATVFFAFAFEAYLNHVGAEELPFWDEIDRISNEDKLTVLAKHLGFPKDASRRPLQTIRDLFKRRNELAHGRTINETITKTSQASPSPKAVAFLLPWEQLTPEAVRRYHDDVQAAIKQINSARRVPDKLWWNEGSRGSTTGASK
jgi:hypothetical protein